ncbi:hypothetical protein HK102_002546, partial [Quaeritorhiza haematococci]
MDSHSSNNNKPKLPPPGQQSSPSSSQPSPPCKDKPVSPPAPAAAPRPQKNSIQKPQHGRQHTQQQPNQHQHQHQPEQQQLQQQPGVTPPASAHTSRRARRGGASAAKRAAASFEAPRETSSPVVANTNATADLPSPTSPTASSPRSSSSSSSTLPPLSPSTEHSFSSTSSACTITSTSQPSSSSTTSSTTTVTNKPRRVIESEFEDTDSEESSTTSDSCSSSGSGSDSDENTPEPCERNGGVSGANRKGVNVKNRSCWQRPQQMRTGGATLESQFQHGEQRRFLRLGGRGGGYAPVAQNEKGALPRDSFGEMGSGAIPDALYSSASAITSLETGISTILDSPAMQCVIVGVSLLNIGNIAIALANGLNAHATDYDPSCNCYRTIWHYEDNLFAELLNLAVIISFGVEIFLLRFMAGGPNYFVRASKGWAFENMCVFAAFWIPMLVLSSPLEMMFAGIVACVSRLWRVEGILDWFLRRDWTVLRINVLRPTPVSSLIVETTTVVEREPWSRIGGGRLGRRGNSGSDRPSIRRVLANVLDSFYFNVYIVAVSILGIMIAFVGWVSPSFFHTVGGGLPYLTSSIQEIAVNTILGLSVFDALFLRFLSSGPSHFVRHWTTSTGFRFVEPFALSMGLFIASIHWDQDVRVGAAGFALLSRLWRLEPMLCSSSSSASAWAATMGTASGAQHGDYIPLFASPPSPSSSSSGLGYYPTAAYGRNSFSYTATSPIQAPPLYANLRDIKAPTPVASTSTLPTVFSPASLPFAYAASSGSSTLAPIATAGFSPTEIRKSSTPTTKPPTDADIEKQATQTSPSTHAPAPSPPDHVRVQAPAREEDETLVRLREEKERLLREFEVARMRETNARIRYEL